MNLYKNQDRFVQKKIDSNSFINFLLSHTILELKTNKKISIINQLIQNSTKVQRTQMKSNYDMIEANITTNQSSHIQKEFITSNYKLFYSNHYCLKDLPDETPASNHITINNVLCQKIGDNFKKITQIQIGKKLIVLEDHYRFEDCKKKEVHKKKNSEDQTYNVELPSSENGSKQKSENDLLMEPDFNQKKDKKNIVKNIVKSYLAWLKAEIVRDNPNSFILKSKNKMDDLLVEMKFNNQLVITMIRDPVLNSSFQYFLKNEAIPWVNESKIMDKNSHIESINVFMKACTNGKIDSFRILKKI